MTPRLSPSVAVIGLSGAAAALAVAAVRRGRAPHRAPAETPPPPDAMPVFTGHMAPGGVWTR